MDHLEPLNVDMLPLRRSPKAILVESKYLEIKNSNPNADLQKMKTTPTKHVMAMWEISTSCCRLLQQNNNIVAL